MDTLQNIFKRLFSVKKSGTDIVYTTYIFEPAMLGFEKTGNDKSGRGHVYRKGDFRLIHFRDTRKSVIKRIIKYKYRTKEITVFRGSILNEDFARALFGSIGIEGYS